VHLILVPHSLYSFLLEIYILLVFPGTPVVGCCFVQKFLSGIFLAFLLWLRLACNDLFSYSTNVMRECSFSKMVCGGPKHEGVSKNFRTESITK